MPKFPQVLVQIAGKSGDNVMNEIRRALREAGASELDLLAFNDELANSKGYNEELTTCSKWVHVGQPG